MAVVGVVYYADDPSRRVFRRVYLTAAETDAEFDNPAHITDGLDPARTAVLVRVDETDLHNFDLTGAP